ncbi:MAG TPA: tRNA pseudouridine(38-40) synthase TruA [Tepidisphaeraceae bacterium]|nr:tRNA pseudouridine(38-40) synthase TruA [Tepidisphaeraceae bacterium]
MQTQRYKLKVAYRGTRYHGWQAQPAIETWKGEPPPPGEGIPTIQGALQKAIAAVVRHPVDVVGSSRTDSGVHAKGQIVHFDTHLTQIPPEGLRRGINSALPPDILVRKVDAVPDYFDAITCASRKRYQYYLWNAEDREVFSNDLAWHRWHRLDADAMSAAGAHLVGEHDFASFCRPGHGRENTVRTVYACEVSFRPPRVVISVEGSGFLWNMVRIIVGTLVQVGVGRFTPDDMLQMLAAKDRTAGGPTAPPHGLYLQWIKTRTPEEMIAVAAARFQRSQLARDKSAAGIVSSAGQQDEIIPPIANFTAFPPGKSGI